MVAAVMEKVDPALSIVSTKLESLKAIGVDKDAILLTADGVAKTTPEAVANDVLNFLDNVLRLVVDIRHVVEATHLESPDVVKTHLESIKCVFPQSHPVSLNTNLVDLGLMSLSSRTASR